MYAVIAVSLGLAAAAAFGAASVLEERSTKQVPERAALSPRLLVNLVRRPLFLAAIGVNVAGAGLQVLALHFGSLSLVQPLLVLSLLFAVVIAAAAVRRQPPDAVLLAGVACCAVGIAGFLMVARPHGGSGTADPTAALPLMAGLAARRWSAAWPRRGGGRGRCARWWLALGCGADFGVNALLLKIVPSTLPTGFADPVAAMAAVPRDHRHPGRLPAEPERVPGGHADRPRAGRDHHRRPAGVHGGHAPSCTRRSPSPRRPWPPRASRWPSLIGGIIALAHRAPRPPPGNAANAGSSARPPDGPPRKRSLVIFQPETWSR